MPGTLWSWLVVVRVQRQPNIPLRHRLQMFDTPPQLRDSVATLHQVRGSAVLLLMRGILESVASFEALIALWGFWRTVGGPPPEEQYSQRVFLFALSSRARISPPPALPFTSKIWSPAATARSGFAAFHRPNNKSSSMDATSISIMPPLR